MKTEKQKYRSMDVWKFLLSKNLVKGLKGERMKGFTLVELVIVIAIVIVLSVVSVPIYRGYVDKAKFSEAYSLLGTVLSAQKAYYAEYGYFLRDQESSAPDEMLSYEPILGIDARGNKYFTTFQASSLNAANNKLYFEAYVFIPVELRNQNLGGSLFLQYNITKGGKFCYDSEIDEAWRVTM